jgi:hypothetical protein
MQRWLPTLLVGVLGVWLWGGAEAQAQQMSNPAYQMQRFYYYPYYYFPHNYWPMTSSRWPEQPGQPYMKPPAYMAYPPFLERWWRYEYWQPQRYYRGFHFWLDQF